MTVVHIVLFKFRTDVSEEHKATFVKELKTLKTLPCVKAQRLVVGGPSITDPIERSKGYHFALLSFHENRKALEEYQASAEHHRVTSTYLWPFKEDVTRFDFEVEQADEHMWDFVAKGIVNGLLEILVLLVKPFHGQDLTGFKEAYKDLCIASATRINQF
ncbi:hypothetical protein CGCS363_v013665 [Colletotrichum siamense]|uniref:uncharacterized protein n=1 Tax=Colletotrichum siamense TaxID=690259 RepID=UPI001872E07A|nr:uncharacterized protein CGCS363_v013665 [Colletotrichum siamense]KAF5487713.1 hypothetical protein CGCS363_v013665 [Colletotrichum siamense]